MCLVSDFVLISFSLCWENCGEELAKLSVILLSMCGLFSLNMNITIFCDLLLPCFALRENDVESLWEVADKFEAW